MHRSLAWYKRAADLGDKRASQRLKNGSANTSAQSPGSVVVRSESGEEGGQGAVGKGGKDKECLIM